MGVFSLIAAYQLYTKKCFAEVEYSAPKPLYVGFNGDPGALIIYKENPDG